MTALSRTREHGYGYLNGRDGKADEMPTLGGFTNNFGTHLASVIRGARESLSSHPEEYEGEEIFVYSTGNLCRDISWTTGRIPYPSVIHIRLEGPRA